jgi:hypothetical protein
LSGDYVLTAIDQAGTNIESPFLEPKRKLFYRLKIENGSEFITNNRDTLDNSIEESKCGTISIKCVHGTTAYILSTRL